MDEAGIRTLGFKEATAELQRVQQGGATFGNLSIAVGSNLPYAWGIEFGRHRGGKLARKAGGLFFLTRALEEVRQRSDMSGIIARGIAEGPEGARRAGRTMAFAVLARAQQLETAVNSGALRNSIQIVEQGGSVLPVGTPFGPAQRRSTPSSRVVVR